ncbi:MAG: hypothetical protein IJ439_02680 [Tyzzerella sp.]|nr:hypothetical protein [Tyzzerella sp.]
MDKRKAIQILTKAAKLYKENLEDQKVLFLYGIPSEIKKEIEKKADVLSQMKYYEVAFHRYNFLHLTGVKVNQSEIQSAIHFYEKCLSNRLKEDDFTFASDGSTVQKLEILENMMQLKKNVTMIGDFTDRGPQLYSKKVAGNICACIGFVKDKNTNLNVPNTLLKKDIRDVTATPTEKVYIIVSKHYADDKYHIMNKLDKAIDLASCKFRDAIESIIDKEKLLS